MFLGLYLEFDSSNIDDLLSDHNLLNPGELRDIANRMVIMIEDRTAQGIDAFGQAFAPYSTAYARKRENAGRSDVVNMSFSNQMLGSMQGSAEGDVALVSFANQSLAQIADYHTSPASRSKIPLRNFLDLDEDGQEARILAEMAADFIASSII